MSTNSERVAKSRKKTVQEGGLRLYGTLSKRGHETARMMVEHGLATSIPSAIELALEEYRRVK